MLLRVGMACLLKGLTDGEDPASHSSSVQCGEDIFNPTFLIYNDETESPRLPCGTVADDLSRFNFEALGLHPLSQVRVRRSIRYVSDEQL
jgi:hypothetical protein